MGRQSTRRLSVVIPAHDEAGHIAELLTALEPIAECSEIVVVANGCNDDTAGIARRTAPWATVAELDVGSKPLALNHGDSLATEFPRMYLDGDVMITASDVIALADRLGTDGLIAVAATPSHDLSRSSWLVRSHYRIWTAMATNSEGLGGANPQVLTATARARFDEWPDVIGDDYFLDGRFSRDEGARIDSVEAVRIAPSGVWDCMSRKARIHAGNVAVLSSGLRPVHEGGGGRAALRVVVSSPRRLVDLPAHLFITIGSRVLYHWRRRQGRAQVFFRDRSRRS